jgi:histidinol-phosphatase (PHP family)
MKTLSSMHTHTLYCDGKDDIETMCLAAYDKKLCAIGFSSHLSIYKQTGWHISEDRISEYIEEVTAAKKRWQGKLAVYLGFEVDYIKGLCSPLDSNIKSFNADYLIGSVHYLVPSKGEPFTVDGEEFEKGLRDCFDGDAQALMHCYYDTVAEMISLGGFDILGHADLVKVNGIRWPVESETIRQKEIAGIAAGITVEVNTGGLNRGKINDTYPSTDFLRILRDRNIPLVITADAHRAADIDGHYDDALQAIAKAGYTEHFIFTGREKGEALWQKIGI